MTAVTTVEVEPLGAALGARVHGVDVREPISPDLADRLRAALDAHQVLVLQGQHDLSAESQTAVAAVFGHPGGSEPWRSIALLDGGTCDPVVVQNFPANQWHSDMSFCPRPTTAGVLSALVIPEVGGDTAFVSTAALYDGLSPAMKAMCEPLVGEHTMWFNGGDAWVGHEPREYIERCKRLLPPAHHPLVQTHPGSGRKFLYIGGAWMQAIQNPEAPFQYASEYAMLHTFLNSQLNNVQCQFRWNWSPGDLVIWDERCTNHMAVHQFGGPERIVRSVWAWPDNEPVRTEEAA